MTKVSKNLSLDADAVARGEQYSARHGTNLSRLVSDFLSRLPVDDAGRDLSPVVRRLLGVAAAALEPSASVDDQADYRAHLWAKYGGAT